MKTRAFPSLKMRLFLIGYAVFWALMLPVGLLYLFQRGKRDPRYRQNIAERFGSYKGTLKNSVWVHAVSLGEMRSAAPLIRRLLDDGETIVTTHFTPAGRMAANDLFAREIAENRMVVIYVPFEFDWVFWRFFHAFTPKYGLVMEIEIWPRLIASARRHDVPLFMCNGQYPEKSYVRDTTRTNIRGELSTGFAGLMVKSETHAERFRSLGAKQVIVTGELRFDQPIPPEHLSAAHHIKPALKSRRVVTIASAVIGEDEVYLQAIQQVQSYCYENNLTPPLFVYVPRAPERFGEVGNMLENAGLTVQRRSKALSSNLAPMPDKSFENADILLGDSLGEMYFYLELSDFAIVGGGFVPKGAHNIIEPLALKKPVIVGPHIWTIEFPAIEAMAAGALTKTDTVAELVQTMQSWMKDADSIPEQSKLAQAFFDISTGATDKTLNAIKQMRAKR